MERHRLVHSLGLIVLTALCWLYGLHLYRAANAPLVDKHVTDTSEMIHEPSVAKNADGITGTNGAVLDDSSDR
ncbi:hypothetical protein EV175_007393, partial [Coemansia sp. RSA 1933]